MMINLEKKREIQERYTKYEIARILGARSLQIAMNAPMLIKIPEEELKEINYDSLRIAEIEFYSGILPISVKRPLPLRKQEKLKKLEISKKELMKQEKKEKKTVKQKQDIQVQKTEVKDVKEEELDKKERIDDGAEIMEMAQPEDEIEENSEETSRGEEGEA